MATDLEVKRKELKPNVPISSIPEILRIGWGLEIEIDHIKPLESYDDANFYIKINHFSSADPSTDYQEYLLKFYNGVESDNTSLLDGYSKLLLQIDTIAGSSKDKVVVPSPVPLQFEAINSSMNDLYYVENCNTISSTPYRIGARLFRWIRGLTMNCYGSNPAILYDLGGYLGQLDHYLQGFDHEGFHRNHVWDLKNLLNSSSFVGYVDDEIVRQVITQVHQSFSLDLLPNHHIFKTSVIMGDCNDANILLDPSGGGKICGLIDFGDAVYTWTISNVAIALCYALLSEYGLQDPLRTVIYILSGYLRVLDFSSEELKYLRTLIASRLSISTSIGAYSISQDPTNEYLKLHSMPARKALVKLWQCDEKIFYELVLEIQELVRNQERLTRFDILEALVGSFGDKLF